MRACFIIRIVYYETNRQTFNINNFLILCFSPFSVSLTSYFLIFVWDFHELVETQIKDTITQFPLVYIYIYFCICP